jgi:hypothetical protein
MYGDQCQINSLISVPQKYKNEQTITDYLLFVGIDNNPENTFIAYAGPCLFGIVMIKISLILR